MSAATAHAVLDAAREAARRGDLDQGATLAGEAHRAFRSNADHAGRMRAAALLGRLAFERGRLPEAELRFTEALRLARRHGDQAMMARATLNLGSLAHQRGDDKAALRHYSDALTLYDQLGDETGRAQSYHQLGRVLRQMGRLLAAGEAVRHALAHAAHGGDRALEGRVLVGAAELALAEQRPHEAAHLLERAEPLLCDDADSLGRVEARRVAALLALWRGEAQEAYALALEAQASAGLRGGAFLEAECTAVCALALRAAGRGAEAERFCAAAIEHFTLLGATGARRRFLREWEGEETDGAPGT
ncbi:MAG: tetratricopeptide repeat protein [Gemmatimonadota bacterium]